MGTDYRDARFAVTGDWLIEDDPDEYNFIYNRHMVHGFSEIEQ